MRSTHSSTLASFVISLANPKSVGPLQEVAAGPQYAGGFATTRKGRALLPAMTSDYIDAFCRAPSLPYPSLSSVSRYCGSKNTIGVQQSGNLGGSRPIGGYVFSFGGRKRWIVGSSTLKPLKGLNKRQSKPLDCRWIAWIASRVSPCDPCTRSLTPPPGWTGGG
jgi:hypothetical protein